MKDLEIIRDSVRCYLVKNGKVVCIKTKMGKEGFFDIPGGKIEEGETVEEAVVREYQEETGLIIKEPRYRGIIDVVFPKGVHRLRVFVVDCYEGKMVETDSHIPYFMDIDTLLQQNKRFACTVMLEPTFRKLLLDNSKSFYLVVHTSEEEVIRKLSFEVYDN